MAKRNLKEHKFELDRLTGSISRQIDAITEDLALCKNRINKNISPEGNIPKENMMDLVMRLGQWCEMQRMSYIFED